jgi:hypothetical protein
MVILFVDIASKSNGLMSAFNQPVTSVHQLTV